MPFARKEATIAEAQHHLESQECPRGKPGTHHSRKIMAHFLHICGIILTTHSSCPVLDLRNTTLPLPRDAWHILAPLNSRLSAALLREDRGHTCFSTTIPSPLVRDKSTCRLSVCAPSTCMSRPVLWLSSQHCFPNIDTPAIVCHPTPVSFLGQRVDFLATAEPAAPPLPAPVDRLAPSGASSGRNSNSRNITTQHNTAGQSWHTRRVKPLQNPPSPPPPRLSARTSSASLIQCILAYPPTH